MLLNLVRLAGIAMVLAAIAMSQLASNIPSLLNIGLGLGGLAVFFFWPRKLASQWKTEDE
ncbi:hypothetical protein [Altererythrobacter sp.]|uniref:hypothetical protein n=1 Tax=Altererythrobacter sp. TaxID=1872480 RepID=UPI001B1ECFDE|nr:hypothetical protein [Altererythrobacter sp.]MBO6608766.1 hypothetical protein [Altererythrobacter sp.]MBO6640806.1 hypothetical protein [Altererythrobacter sp.]MBO6708496.1 hypothetical protein [Altererythrobacter sp.]MBO6945368.1 hypothetical protein [Altererythrobacter sp.]